MPRRKPTGGNGKKGWGLEETRPYEFDQRQLLPERPWRGDRRAFPVREYPHWIGFFTALGLYRDEAWGTLRN